jgi:hypothetical protein
MGTTINLDTQRSELHIFFRTPRRRWAVGELKRCNGAPGQLSWQLGRWITARG